MQTQILTMPWTLPQFPPPRAEVNSLESLQTAA